MPRYQPVRLSNDWTVQPGDDGTPEMVFDDRGNARTYNELPLRLRQEYSLSFGKEQEFTSHFEALAAKEDPAFEEISDWITRHASPEELLLIQGDPDAFAHAYKLAKENIGTTYAELNAEEAREDRRVELTQLLRAGKAGPADVGELLDLGGMVPAEELPDADEE